MSYEKNWLQMKQALKKAKAAPDEPARERPALKREEPARSAEWKAAGLERCETELGVYFQRTVQFPLDAVHGRIQLGELDGALRYMQTAHPSHPLAPPEGRVRFYDTETTGLKGAGAYIFLNGFLERVDGGLRLTQQLLADPSHEAAFLAASGLQSGGATVVTYNGKSFDIPQLQARWTLNRFDLPPLKPIPHIDLLHAARRIWRGELDRFRLSEIEEQKLGFTRIDDLPGHLAPIAYVDAVQHGGTAALLRVFQHNEWDLLTLAAFYVLSVELLRSEEVIETAGAYTNIAKWFLDEREYDASLLHNEKVIAAFSARDAGLARYYAALQLKRTGRYEESRSALRSAVPYLVGRDAVRAQTALSKLEEHQFGDATRALACAYEAYRLLARVEREAGRPWKSARADLSHRIARLRKKAGLPSPESAESEPW